MKQLDYDTALLQGSEPLGQSVEQTGRRTWNAIIEKTVSCFRTLCEWQMRALMRERMKNLDDRMLDDIGLTREQVDQEAEKPFWVR